MERTLGPRNVGDILKETFIIYKNNFSRLAAIIAISVIPSAIVTLYINLSFLLSNEEATMRSLVGRSLVGALLSVPLYLVVSVISVFTIGATTHAIAEQYFHRPISFSRAFSFAWHRFGTMLGAFFLVLLVVMGLSITIIGIPAAIYFAITWAFILPVALLEGCSPTAALSRSAALVKQNWWRVLGILLLLGIIIWAILSIPLGIDMAIQIFTQAMTQATAQSPIWITIWSSTIIGLIVGLIGTPFLTIGETLLYFDLRVRKQGYSLDALTGELGITGTVPDPTVNPQQ